MKYPSGVTIVKGGEGFAIKAPQSDSQNIYPYDCYTYWDAKSQEIYIAMGCREWALSKWEWNFFTQYYANLRQQRTLARKRIFDFLLQEARIIFAPLFGDKYKDYTFDYGPEESIEPENYEF